jgi:hypothetical protein
MINEKDVEIMLKNLAPSNEDEFCDLLFEFVSSGTIDKDRFRELIIGARELAYEDGFEHGDRGIWS